MIQIFVKIHVKNYIALEKFETEAAKIMRDHQGRFLTAFETLRNPDNTGEEIHILEFASEEHFQQYRNDERHQSLKNLREDAVLALEVKISQSIKFY